MSKLNYADLKILIQDFHNLFWTSKSIYFEDLKLYMSLHNHPNLKKKQKKIFKSKFRYKPKLCCSKYNLGTEIFLEIDYEDLRVSLCIIIWILIKIKQLFRNYIQLKVFCFNFCYKPNLPCSIFPLWKFLFNLEHDFCIFIVLETWMSN